MIDKLKEMNNKLILINKDDEIELRKQHLIREILNKKDVFLNIKIEYAYSILRDLKIEEENIEKVYLKLIDGWICKLSCSVLLYTYFLKGDMYER